MPWSKCGLAALLAATGFFATAAVPAAPAPGTQAQATASPQAPESAPRPVAPRSMAPKPVRPAASQESPNPAPRTLRPAVPQQSPSPSSRPAVKPLFPRESPNAGLKPVRPAPSREVPSTPAQTPVARPGSPATPAGQAASTPAASTPATPTPATPAPAVSGPPRFLVVLDASHGGDDLGGHLSSGQYEKTANLAVSVRLRSLLGARGIQVITTRESDQSVDVNRRAEIANHAAARACISLHTADTGSGIHLFVSSLAPAASTRFTPWKTAQSAFVTRSLALAGVLNSALLQSGTTVTLGRTPLPGIESMTCPAIAVELGPQRDSSHKITAQPDDPDYQARIAASLAAALLEWRTEAGRTEGRQP